MRSFTWFVVGWALAFVVAIGIVGTAGCQATYTEGWGGPKVAADKPAAQYVPVGVGEWTDAAGKKHVEPVYARRDGVHGDRGDPGVRGPAGRTGPTSCPSGWLESLPRVRVRPEQPSASGGGFAAQGGQYHREIEVPWVPWGQSPAEPLGKIKPFEHSGERLPDYDGKDGSIGTTRGGSFLGGGLESAVDVVRRGPILLCVIGALAVLAGIVLAVWAKRVVLGLAVAGGGGGLIAAGVLFEAYPWVLLIGLAAVLGLGVWWIVDAKFAAKAKIALSAIVRGVEAAPEEAQAAVKESIGSAATASGQYTAVKETISQVKAKSGV